MEVVDGGRLGGGGRVLLPGAGATTTGAVDEVWLYFKDDFGQLRLGSVESARQEMTNFAPNGAYNFGVNSPFFTFATGSWLATYDDGLGNEDAAKLVYFTPTFNGFRLGLSWAPDDNDGGQRTGHGGQPLRGQRHLRAGSGDRPAGAARLRRERRGRRHDGGQRLDPVHAGHRHHLLTTPTSRNPKGAHTRPLFRAAML